MIRDNTRAVTRVAAGEVPGDPTDIFQALNAARVQYMVVGGVAAIGYGTPRHTFDVDVAVRLEVANLQRFKRAMTRLGFVTRVPADVMALAEPRQRRVWTQCKGMKVFSYLERRPPFRVVDVMVKPFRDFTRLYRRRVTVRYGGARIPLVPITTLIRMKTGTGRLQDQEDVAYLRGAQRRVRGGRST